MVRASISNLLGKITIVVVICCFCLPVQAKYGGGTGEPNDPYLIFDANQMNAIGADSNDWDKHFKLMADIDLGSYTGTEFNIIGDKHYDGGWVGTAFTGVFDGNGHTISNFSYTSTFTDHIGLFGYVEGENAEIKDLGLIDPNVDAGTKNRVGSLVGALIEGTIANCYVEGGRIIGDSSIGGLVGVNKEGTITNCYSTSDVSGYLGAGGLVGSNDGTITKCYSICDVSGHHAVGGLVGTNIRYISNCYSAGSTSGDEYIGGLLGHNSSLPGGQRGTVAECYAVGSVYGAVNKTGGLVGTNSGHITNCYSRVSVTASGDYAGGIAGLTSIDSTVINCYAAGRILGNGSYFGGVVGYSDISDSLSTCYWDIETSGLNNMCGDGDCNDLNGKSTSEMQQQSTFTNWDFVNIWTICKGTNYPRFFWQIPIGDFVCPDGVDFIDYSFFSLHWQEENCDASNDCEGADLDKLSRVDYNDLAIFLDSWLTGVKVGLPPGHASNPNPADGATGVSLTADLSWTAGVDVTSHDIYFGTSNPPPFIQNQTITSFDTGIMSYVTTYYWRIDEIGATCKIQGLLWNFTTVSKPPPPPP